jgi:hypothetical protein
MPDDVRALETALRLRYQDRSCDNCRYFRIHHGSDGWTSMCLLLGRDLGTAATDYNALDGWARERVCDGWSRRPKSWRIYSEGLRSPYWDDPYLPRELNERRRKRLAAKLRGRSKG